MHFSCYAETRNFVEEINTQPKAFKRIREHHLSRWRFIPIFLPLFQPSLLQDTYSRYIFNAEQLIQTEGDSQGTYLNRCRFQDTYCTPVDRNFSSSESKLTSQNHNSTFHLCQQTLCRSVHSAVPRAYHPDFSYFSWKKTYYLIS